MKRKRTGKLAGLLVLLLLLTGCSPGQNSGETQSPDRQEPVSAVSGASEPEPVHEYDRVRREAEGLIEGYLQKSVSYQHLSDPEDRYNLSEVKNVQMLSMLTGEYSLNQTKTRYGVGGTDLGICVDKGDETFIFFGDTFRHETMEDNWRSNVAAVTTDRDYTDGIIFDRMITTKTGVAKELLRGKKSDNNEVTKIPTGGICIGDALYLSFMSVKHWGEPGEWDCNYGAVAKSTDDGESWEILEQLQWEGDTEFCQMAPVIVEDMVYVPGVGGGRSGNAKLIRVPVSQYENREAFEYLTGYAEDGSPIFEKDALERAAVFLPGPVGEMSFLYSEYLGEWLVTYLSAEDLVLRTAKDIWGPYSKPVTIAAQKDYPGLYGAFMDPHYVSEDGKKIGFLMSLWSPVYNVAVMEMELVRDA